jgi:agmatine deiminase
MAVKTRVRRRTFLKSSLSATTLFGPKFSFSRAAASLASPASQGWYMPAEGMRHSRCWMAWPARKEIWGSLLEDARRNIALVANTIAQFEPVAMAVGPDQREGAARLCSSAISFFTVAVDDFWARDTGPSFLVREGGGLAGSAWNFNGWGDKQVHGADAGLARRILAHVGVACFDAPMVTEGGALEVDGDGTLICTSTSILNPNRNPGMTRDQAEGILKGWLGLSKVIWLPDQKPDFWTDGHIDGYAKFVRPGVVLFELSADPNDVDYLNRQNMLRALEQEIDARGRKLQVIKLFRPLESPGRSPNYCDCYINFYLANGGVVMPKYGNGERDALAYDTVSKAFPERQTIQLQVDTIASGGGSIHCTTQQEPIPLAR